MKNYKLNKELSKRLYEEAVFLVRRNACYINCFDIKEHVEVLETVKGLNLRIGFGYIDAHGYGIYNRHCFFVNVDNDEIIDPTMPCYGFDLDKLDIDFKVFDIITFEEFNKYNLESFGYCDWRFSKAEYEFLKPFYGTKRTNMEKMKELIDRFGTLLTIGEEDFFRYVLPMFKTEKSIEDFKRDFIKERTKKKEIHEAKKRKSFNFKTLEAKEIGCLEEGIDGFLASLKL